MVIHNVGINLIFIYSLWSNYYEFICVLLINLNTTIGMNILAIKLDLEKYEIFKNKGIPTA